MRRRKVNKEKLTAGGGGYPDSFPRRAASLTFIAISSGIRHFIAKNRG